MTTEVHNEPTTDAGAGALPEVASVEHVPARTSMGSVATTSVPDTARLISIRGPMEDEMKVIHDIVAERERIDNLRANRPRVVRGSSTREVD
jgi:hypothetical protein